MKFTLSIELGNDAMRTKEDVARELRKVAKRLELGTHGGRVMDENGNAVGLWSFPHEVPDDG